MKIALTTNSLLLERSLEMYLKEFLTSHSFCEFIIATEPIESNKPVFLIGDFPQAHLRKPFTKELLLKKLDSFYTQIQEKRKTKQENINHYSKKTELDAAVKSTPSSHAVSRNDALLEEKIQEVLGRYTQEIKAIMLDHFRG